MHNVLIFWQIGRVLTILIIRLSSGFAICTAVMAANRPEQRNSRVLCMLWTSLRWNLGNTSAIVAFCLLPIVTFADAGSSDRQPAVVAAWAKLQNDNAELTAALPVINLLTIMPAAASPACGANDRCCDAEVTLPKYLVPSS